MRGERSQYWLEKGEKGRRGGKRGRTLVESVVGDLEESGGGSGRGGIVGRGGGRRRGHGRDGRDVDLGLVDVCESAGVASSAQGREGGKGGDEEMRSQQKTTK